MASINPDVIERARKNEFLVTRATQADNAIKYIGDRVHVDGPPVRIPFEPASFAARIGATTIQSAAGLMAELDTAGLVVWSVPSSTGKRTGVADLTLNGWREYEEITRGAPSRRYGFFAWEFGREVTKRIFREVLKPAFEARGYPLKDMNDLAQPGLIDHIMQHRIRSASFVIVDLTDHNRGSYWEGGFAQGIDKPVVYIMHKPAFDENPPHFDLNHYTIVFWGVDGETDDVFLERLISTLEQGGLLGI